VGRVDRVHADVRMTKAALKVFHEHLPEFMIGFQTHGYRAEVNITFEIQAAQVHFYPGTDVHVPVDRLAVFVYADPFRVIIKGINQCLFPGVLNQ